jgi:hypothetical protein
MEPTLQPVLAALVFVWAVGQAAAAADPRIDLVEHAQYPDCLKKLICLDAKLVTWDVRLGRISSLAAYPGATLPQRTLSP